MPDSSTNVKRRQNPCVHSRRTRRSLSDRFENATRASMAWYVSYRTGGTTVMHVLKGRELAIDIACRFFDHGYRDLLEVGPMLGSREGNVLDEGDIQRIQEARRSSPTALTKPDRRRAFWGGL